jgi:hypothetical protein
VTADAHTREGTDRLMDLMRQIATFRIEISSEVEHYDLLYIAERSARCASEMESLSNINCEIAIIGAESTVRMHELQTLRRLTEMEKKGSQEYQDLARDEKTLWLNNQLSALDEKIADLKLLSSLVSQTSALLAERSGTVKRLDSTLRLQAKLHEAKTNQGAAPSYHPSQAKDLEI